MGAWPRSIKNGVAPIVCILLYLWVVCQVAALIVSCRRYELFVDSWLVDGAGEPDFAGGLVTNEEEERLVKG